MFLACFSTIIILVKLSTTTKNNNNEREKPCLNPLVALKKEDGIPLMIIEKCTYEIQDMLRSTTLKVSPNLYKANFRNV